MQHNKKAIKNTKKRGAFDDRFDPLSLDLSDKEKKKLINKMSPQKNIIQPPLPEKNNNSQLDNKSKKDEHQLGLFERLLRFFTMLFLGLNNKEYERRHQLSLIKNKLRKIKPAIYNFKRKTVQEALAIRIFNIFDLVFPYKKIFNKIFSDEKLDTQIDFQFFFLKNVSVNPELKKADKFSIDSLFKMVDEEEEQTARKKTSDSIDSFLNSFSDSEITAIDKTFSEMINFHDLLDFNFTSLLRKFNNSYSPFENIKPIFKEAQYEGISKYLQDLESVLLILKLKFIPHILDTAKTYYKSHMMPETPDDNERSVLLSMEKLSSENYRPLINSISSILANDTITLLIQYIDDNPNYENHIYPRKTNFFAKFSSNLKGSTENRIGSLYRKKAKEEIKESIHLLFEMEKLPDPYVYSENVNPLLLKFELPEFIYPVPLNFCLTFYKIKYFPYIKKTINRLLIDGSFRNSLVQRTISDEFYFLDDIHSEILKFILLVDPNTDKGSSLSSIIRNFKGDLPSKKTLTSRINSLNQKVYPVLKRVKKSFQNLQIGISKVIKDLDRRNPETIDNLKKIGINTHGRFLIDFKKTEHDITLFAAIFSKIFKDVK